MKDYQRRVKDILSREKPENLLPWLAYDQAFRLIYCEGGFLGRVYEASLLSGIDNTSISQLVGALNQDFEPGTFIQIIKLSIPEVSGVLAGYASARMDLNQDTELTADQIALLGRSADAELNHLADRIHNKALYQDSGIYLHSSRLILSIKVPVALVPTDQDIEETSRRISSAVAAFSGAGLKLRELELPEFLAFVRRCFFIDRPDETWWDKDKLIREQIFGPGDSIDQDGGFIDIEREGVSKTLSIISMKHFPEQMALPVIDFLGGDPNGVRDQIKQPYMMAYSVYIPDQLSKRRSVTSKSTALNYQAYGPLLRWIPKLAYRKKGMDALIHATTQGNRIVELDFRVILYNNSRREAERASQSFITMAEGIQFQMARDTLIHYPMFLNSLPLFPTVESIGLTHRYKTMAANQAAQFMPIMEDWQGTRTPIVMLTTRRGLPMPIDLYDATTNYNFLVSGDSGSGKSVIAQALLWGYLSIGAACYIIEIGNSFRKFCNVFGGSHLRFDEDSNICINPFSTITELNEEIEILTSIVATMIAPRDDVDDYRRALIREAIRSVFGKLGTRMTPTDIQEFLFAQEDEDNVQQEMGKMMSEFCQSGAYGHWFNGPANIDLGARLVVLELEDLISKDSLRRVVELALIQRVSREMYERRPGQKKVLFIDEASETLNGPGMEQFVSGAYERIRKHNGAVGVGLQDVTKLANSSSNAGRAVIGLSTFKFLMKQPSGTVELMREHKIMSEIGDWGYEQVKGLRTVPNLYSEVFVASSLGKGVGRLQLDRYRQVLFSTRGAERELIFQWMNDGMSGAQAIQRFLELEAEGLLEQHNKPIRRAPVLTLAHGSGDQPTEAA